MSHIPFIRREDGCLVGTSRTWTKRWVRPRLRQVWARVNCLLRGHDFTQWVCDDYEGAGSNQHGFWIPHHSRDAAPTEWGWRVCRRKCGTQEHRWPEKEAPLLWFAKLAHQERKGDFPSTVPHHTISHYKTGKRP